MRICFYAGANAGKSTVSPGVLHQLKKKGYNVEGVSEYIKKWAYEKKIPRSYDQLYIFAKQLNSEDFFLQYGVEHIVTDSPVFLQAYYARKFGFPQWEQLVEIAQGFEAANPAFNIFLDREGIEWVQLGRYETEEEAIENDKQLQLFMKEHVGDFTTCKSVDFEGIMSTIEYVLNE